MNDQKKKKVKSNFTLPVNDKTKLVCKFVWNKQKLSKVIILSQSKLSRSPRVGMEGFARDCVVTASPDSYPVLLLDHS